MIQRYGTDQWDAYCNDIGTYLKTSPDLVKTNIFLGSPHDALNQIDTMVEIIHTYRNHIEYVRLYGDQWLEVDRKKIGAYHEDYQYIVYEGLLFKVYNSLEHTFTTEYRPQSQWWLWNCSLDDNHLKSQLIH